MCIPTRDPVNIKDLLNDCSFGEEGRVNCERSVSWKVISRQREKQPLRCHWELELEASQ